MPEVKQQEQQEAPPPKKSGKRLIVIVVAALVVLGGGGAAAWMFLKPGHVAVAGEAHSPQKKPTSFTSLEPFTVNLADAGGDRFAQISIVLEVAEGKAGEEISAHMPAIRNAVLLLISSKQSSDLLTVPGKEQLAREIASTVGQQIGWTPPENKDPVKKIPVSDTTAPSADPAPKGAGETQDPVGAADSQAQDPATAQTDAAAAPGIPNPIAAVNFTQFIVQ